MAREHAHRAIAFCGAVTIAAAATYTYGLHLAGIAAASCMLGEFWAGPDRDLDTGARHWTWWVTGGFVWAMYAVMIPHRSRLSHWPVLGAAGRVLYLVGPVVAVLLFAGHDRAVWQFVSANEVELIAAYLGLEVSGVLHWVSDRCP